MITYILLAADGGESSSVIGVFSSFESAEQEAHRIISFIDFEFKERSDDYIYPYQKFSTSWGCDFWSAVNKLSVSTGTDEFYALFEKAGGWPVYGFVIYECEVQS